MSEININNLNHYRICGFKKLKVKQSELRINMATSSVIYRGLRSEWFGKNLQKMVFRSTNHCTVFAWWVQFAVEVKNTRAYYWDFKNFTLL